MIRPPPYLPAITVLIICAVATPRLHGALARGQVMQADDPMPVLTDTMEYCTQLEHRINERPNRPPEVLRLTTEGHQMCDHGEIRAGISRLRRALGLIKHRPGYVVLPSPK